MVLCRKCTAAIAGRTEIINRHNGIHIAKLWKGTLGRAFPIKMRILDGGGKDMAYCGICGNRISWGEKTWCNRCRTKYHKTCILSTADRHGKIRCPNCGHTHRVR